MSGGQDQTELSGLLGGIYDAAMDETPLPRFLEAVSAALAAHGVVLEVQEERLTGDGGAAGEDAADGGAAFDDGGAVATLERTAVQGELVTEVHPSDQPSDPRGPMTLGYFKGTDPDHRAKLVLRFADDAAGQDLVLGDLVSHVGRAIQLHRHLVGRRIQGGATNRMLDTVPLGVILANAGSRVLHTNRMADDILAQNDGLTTDRTGLCTSVPKETARLRKVIGQVAAAGDQPNRTPVGVIRVERPSMARAWLLVVVPVDTTKQDEGAAQMAAVFVSDGDRAPEIPPEVLERLFGVTPAESRLLVALVDGFSLDEAAEQFKVSKNTLRNQLNQIFRKTETSKQSELVRMVLTSPAPVLMSSMRKTKPDDD